MPVLDNETKTELNRIFTTLAGPVKLKLYTEEHAEGLSSEIAELLLELGGLSEKVSVDVRALAESGEPAARYGIERAPAIVVEAERDYGIRYYGAPAGYEFGSLIEVMLDVARGDVELSKEVRAGLERLQDPVHIKVFVTPG